MKATATKDYTIGYTEKDGILYPDLKLPEQTIITTSASTVKCDLIFRIKC